MVDGAKSIERKISREEQLLSDSLLQLLQGEQPQEAISRLKILFVDGRGYPDKEVSTALERIVSLKQPELAFNFVLNRCCHAAIALWYKQPENHSAIAELVGIFESPSNTSLNPYLRSPAVKRQDALVKKFAKSEQYRTLQRLSLVVVPGKKINGDSDSQALLGDLVSGYPYLFSHALAIEGSSYEYQQTVRRIQSRRQRQLEKNLSQYVTYQVRRSLLLRRTALTGAQPDLPPLKNPTQLRNKELYRALKEFVGKGKRGHTYRDFAHNFLSHAKLVRSYGDFKVSLYKYLAIAINSDYGKQKFCPRLAKYLKQTLAQSDEQKLNDFLIQRTCSQLLNYLVVDNSQKLNHLLFLELASNLGAIQTAGLLLKIVLICPKVKPHLEKRLWILFNYYETSPKETVAWFVSILENLNVAFTSQFGSVDLSFISQIASSPIAQKSENI
ncbi:MAG: hypothetical protein F6J93_32025 [Oscillatoria sp. SIO1A7]|nr:hypothetical protein [Oscillatoria sp. SIO1A7]